MTLTSEARAPDGRERAKERPIISSAPMVRAILAGRKTQTRRVIRDAVPEAPGMDHVHSDNRIRHAAPYLDAYCCEKRTPANPRGMGDWWCWWTRDDRAGPQFKVGFKPGDRLWVREAWTHDAANLDALRSAVEDVYCDLSYGPYYRATEVAPDTMRWRSPTHMPRWASRLTLEVTEVRVERLHDISDEDARAEGALRPATNLETGQDGYWAGKPSEARFVLTRREAFAELWNSIHGKNAWDANPWVAAITFRSLSPTLDSQNEGPGR